MTSPTLVPIIQKNSSMGWQVELMQPVNHRALQHQYHSVLWQEQLPTTPQETKTRHPLASNLQNKNMKKRLGDAMHSQWRQIQREDGNFEFNLHPPTRSATLIFVDHAIQANVSGRLQQPSLMDLLSPLTIPRTSKSRSSSNPRQRNPYSIIDAPDPQASLFPKTISVTVFFTFVEHPIFVDDIKLDNFDWTVPENYEVLIPTKILEKVQKSYDLESEQMYRRHGSSRVKGPPGLHVYGHYAILDDMEVLSPKMQSSTSAASYPSYPSQPFSLEVYWDYGFVKLQKSGHQSYADMIMMEMKRKLKVNFMGFQYIPRCDLDVFLSLDMVAQIVDEDTNLQLEGAAWEGGILKDAKGKDASERDPRALGKRAYWSPETEKKRAGVSQPIDLWALDCVFLELLLWSFGFYQDGNEAGFSTARESFPGYDSDNLNDMFWYKVAGRGRGRPSKLKPAVDQVLRELAKEHCVEMRVFQRVIGAIQELLEIDPDRRMKAERLAEWMSQVVRQTEGDLRATGIPNFYQDQYHRNRGGSEVGQELLSEWLDPEGSPSVSRTPQLLEQPPTLAPGRNPDHADTYRIRASGPHSGRLYSAGHRPQVQ
ncbi:hypothetical protein PV08_02536 [Exophiala spinifera]|uniref:Protein kinase domain-containing protein n=1 Tax=Exophiala spinifera TaxID=91928 RepID=A0A0D2BGW5_9EURO|nr:uncharacterized protein PV08_02536 [Exophiala spinifera]KIW18248.1 hypothetical protein PV08_02536 [Exophiala spinifera]